MSDSNESDIQAMLAAAMGQQQQPEIPVLPLDEAKAELRKALLDAQAYRDANMDRLDELKAEIDKINEAGLAKDEACQIAHAAYMDAFQRDVGVEVARDKERAQREEAVNGLPGQYA